MRCLIPLLLVLLVPAARAQTPPVVYAEYFIDADPGHGRGTPIPLSAGDALDLGAQVNVTNISPGHHTLYVRARDAEGRWSPAVVRPFYRASDGAGAPLAEVRWTLRQNGAVVDEATVDDVPAASVARFDLLVGPDALSAGDGYTLDVHAVDVAGRRSRAVYHGFSVGTNRFPVVTAALPDLVLDPGFQNVEVGDLTAVFSDPDLPDDALSYSATASAVLVEPVIEGSLLRLSATSTADGTVYVTAEATDAAGSWATSTFAVTVGTGVGVEDEAAAPERFALEPNYPNPFNPMTTIGYLLPRSAHVRVEVFDVVGRRVATLVDGVRPAGWHEARFDASGLPSGVYLYRFRAGAGTHDEVRTMVLVR